MFSEMKTEWYFKEFQALELKELYELLRLRCDIFVVEQECAYPELDGMDYQAIHQLGYDTDHTLAAYCRLFAPGIVYPEVALGRIVVSPKFRGHRLGHVLMEKALDYVHTNFGNQKVKISAQAPLESFYGEHGFLRVSEDYLLDGIPHMDMILH